MDIGIAFDLRSDFRADGQGPDDRLEEYDSEGTVDAIAAAIEAHGHRARRVFGGRRFIETMLASPPEMVFNISEGFGTRSREAHVPAVCEMLGIPFTHSDPLTLALTLDKGMAKRVVAGAGVPTPPFAVVRDPAELGSVSLEPPLIAKPLFEGSSMGIRKTSRSGDARELEETVAHLVGDYGQPAIVEEFCPGEEFTIGILGTGESASVVGVMEIVPRHGKREDFIYSLEVKRNYLEEVDYHVPPICPKPLADRAAAVALEAYRVLGCRDVSRVDVRVGRDGEPKFIEVNPLPGLNPVTGDLVILANRSGMEYTGFIGRILEQAIIRHRRRTWDAG